jgi:hypothetical protein
MIYIVLSLVSEWVWRHGRGTLAHLLPMILGYCYLAFIHLPRAHKYASQIENTGSESKLTGASQEEIYIRILFPAITAVVIARVVFALLRPALGNL